MIQYLQLNTARPGQTSQTLIWLALKQGASGNGHTNRVIVFESCTRLLTPTVQIIVFVVLLSFFYIAVCQSVMLSSAKQYCERKFFVARSVSPYCSCPFRCTSCRSKPSQFSRIHPVAAIGKVQAAHAPRINLPVLPAITSTRL